MTAAIWRWRPATATGRSWVSARSVPKASPRQAALHLAFAGLCADTAATRAWHDNVASLGVTRSLPYSEGTPAREMRRGRPDTMLTFSMTRLQWQTVRRDDIHLEGTEQACEFLGITAEG